MSNPFDGFKLKTKKVKIKALDNKEVTISEMTVAQSNEFYKQIVTGYDADGQPIIEYNVLPDVNLEKVATCMVEPKLTVEELKELSAGASAAINEIADAIDKFGEELKN